MNPEQSLNHLCERYLGNIYLIREFLREIGRFLTQKQKQTKSKPKQFGKDDVKELKK